MKYISTRTVAQRLGISVSRVNSLMRQGRLIPAKKDSWGYTWFDPKEVERFAKLPRNVGRPRKNVDANT